MISLRFLALTTFCAFSVLGFAAIAQDQPAVENATEEPVVVEAAPPVETPKPEAEIIVEQPVAPETTAPVADQSSAVSEEEKPTAAADQSTEPAAEPAVASPVEEAAPVTAETPTETPPTPAAEQESTSQPTTAEKEAEPVIPLPALSEDVPVEKSLLDQLRLRKPPIDIEKMPSLFLTVWERDLVINARKGQLARDPDAPEDIPAPEDTTNKYEGPRDLRLSGIVYRSSKDWVIWLNARRITPRAIPKEIMDLKVYKDYIELEWFDSNTNQIFPVRLRPQQRFNLDARIFLPG